MLTTQKDIKWSDGQWTYSSRAAGVWLQGSQVLLQRLRGDTKWALPGGKVRLGELSQEAVVREFREELELTVTATRPLWVTEMLFDLRGRRNHQACCYFLVTHPKVVRVRPTDDRLEFQWFDIGTLSGRIAPDFLAKGLVSLPAHVQYIATRD